MMIRMCLGLALVWFGLPEQASSQAPPGLRERAVTLAHAPASPAPVVQRAFDSGGADTAYDLWPLPDGGFVMSGSIGDSESSDLDAFVARLDREGRLVWSRRLGGPRVEIGFAVRTLANGTIVMAGWTQSFGSGEGDFYVLGLAGDGTTRFEATFGGAGEERATGLVATRDGGAAIVGESYSHGAGDSRFYLVKIDADGRLQWERTYDGGPLHERGLVVLEDEAGFVLAGNSMDSRSGSSATVSDGYVVRTGPDGAELWSRRYGGDAHDIVHHAARLPDGRVLLTGYTRGFGARGENDVWLVILDDAGEVAGQQLVGGDAADHNISARSGPGGRTWLAGYTRSRGAGGWDTQVIGLDAAGEVVRDDVYGTAGDDGATMAVPLADGGLAVAGYTDRPGGGARDILFFRVGPVSSSSPVR